MAKAAAHKITITEGALRFEFPQGWDASKFDEWSFYRGQFARVGDAEILCRAKNCGGVAHCAKCGTKRMAGTRGIDILAVDPGSVCWHVEIKDYRTTRETNFAFLADMVALKVRDTLSCLIAARLNSNDDIERHRSEQALDCSSMRIILHLEMPPTHTRLLTPKMQRALVTQRLRQLVKAIDPRPRVISMADMPGLDWSVTSVDLP
jgi:hypothetical protein